MREIPPVRFQPSYAKWASQLPTAEENYASWEELFSITFCFSCIAGAIGCLRHGGATGRTRQARAGGTGTAHLRPVPQGLSQLGSARGLSISELAERAS